VITEIILQNILSIKQVYVTII